MSVNTSKTKSLLITTLQKRTTLTSSALNVQIGVRYVEQVHHAKLFGVIIDSSMSWEHHIDTICCIVSGRLSLLRCTKPYLNFDSALRFYNSCVINYFIYCSAVWGNCSHHLLLWLLRLQKRAGCIPLDADFSLTSLPLFLKLKWIPVFILRRHSNFFPPFSNLIYEIYFSHAYPLQSTWRIFCARFAAILYIVNVLHNANHNPCRVFCTYFALFHQYV